MIDKALKKMNDAIEMLFNSITIIFPKIGCGLGNLEWSEVRELIVKNIKSDCVEELILIEDENEREK